MHFATETNPLSYSTHPFILNPNPMDGMNHDHAMAGMMAPPPAAENPARHKMMMMMHMTFFWGKNTEILFDGWPGTSTGMYALALVFVFVLSFIVEGLSHSRLLKPGPNNKVVVGLVQTLMHALRMGLAYMAMLAMMSFNGGVFLAGVAGHAAGFLVFGSNVFRKAETHAYEENTDLPPMSC